MRNKTKLIAFGTFLAALVVVALLVLSEDLEELGEVPNWRDISRLATRVVVDESYRRELISEDPDLPRLWKRR